jgi:hypothetical protein
LGTQLSGEQAVQPTRSVNATVFLTSAGLRKSSLYEGELYHVRKARPLDVQGLLEYARAAVAVLRALQISKTTMAYADFAKAIVCEHW